MAADAVTVKSPVARVKKLTTEALEAGTLTVTVITSAFGSATLL
jgi:hypothetical protein